MIKSMTGYGKAVATLPQALYTVEIRSVNGKGADVSLKTPLLPKEKETEVKQTLASLLRRGSIDLFLTVQQTAARPSGVLNRELIAAYAQELRSVQASLAQPLDETGLLAAVLRLPDVVDTTKKDLEAEEWALIAQAIRQAAQALDAFRCQEGARLATELLSHVDKIEALLQEVEVLDPERQEGVRSRLQQRLEEIAGTVGYDANRFEQELIYYLEKNDVTEEKIRLKQHCTYFRQTLGSEEDCGRKLGFIAQEMGREINTLGSKASHAGIQRLVVMMKDELEKIKEQVLNVL